MPAPAQAIRAPNRPWLRRFVDAWCRLAQYEEGGRIYEKLGLRPVFVFIAALFGESLPAAASTPYGTVPLRADEWLRTYIRTRYHELLNAIALGVYTPFLCWLIWQQRWGQAAYCAVLMLTHKLALLLERYKRGRYDELLRQAGIVARHMDFSQLWKPQEAVLPPVLTCSAARWYFQPKRFETERLYCALGVRCFQAFVLSIFRAAATEDTGPGSAERFIGGREDVLAFEQQTRIAEATHLVGMLLHVPFAIGAVIARDVWGGAYVAGMLGVNLACVVLQRWHRVRLDPVVRRIRATAR